MLLFFLFDGLLYLCESCLQGENLLFFVSECSFDQLMSMLVFGNLLIESFIIVLPAFSHSLPLLQLIHQFSSLSFSIRLVFQLGKLFLELCHFGELVFEELVELTDILFLRLEFVLQFLNAIFVGSFMRVLI